MNLITEYVKRHGMSPFVMACHDGLIFLRSEKEKLLIVHTSLIPKTHKWCDKCKVVPSVVVEIMKFSGSFPQLEIIHHGHIIPDHNLLRFVENNLGFSVVPLKYKNKKWCEEMIISSFLEKTKDNSFSTHPIEKAFNLSIKSPHLFITLYSAIDFALLGRKYIEF